MIDREKKEDIMSSKIVIMLVSSNIEKMKIGLLYGTNAKKNGWIDDVKFMLLGKSEKTILDNPDLLKLLNTNGAVACKFVAEEEKITEKLIDKGMKVEYVGEMLSNYIKQGYTPLTF